MKPTAKLPATIDIVVPGHGRLHRRIHSKDKAVIKGVRAAVRSCLERGRHDVLSCVIDGSATLVQLHDAYAVNDLNRLIKPKTAPVTMLAPKWAEFEVACPASANYRKDFRLAGTQLRALKADTAKGETAPAWEDATINDLPALVGLLRGRYELTGQAVTFNRHRRTCMAFVTWALKRMKSPLWVELSLIPTMTYRRPKKPGLTVAAFREGVAKLPPAHAAIAWSLVLSGMNVKEYWEDGWEQDPVAGTVTVHGEKAAGRRRVLPYLAALSVPERAYRPFNKQVHKAFGAKVTPHTLRRTFIQWAEKAGVPRAFVKMYCGHAVPRDVTELYEDEELTATAMAEHRKLMVAYIGRPLGLVDLALETRSA